jgi:uncharacterized protein (TIGR02145 family)
MKKLSVILLLFFGLVGFSAAQTVTIGNQVWTTKNLNVDKFRNGEAIPQAKTIEEWEAAAENKQPAWCYHEFNPDYSDVYGKIYNWHAVNDPRGLAPKGWHIPSDAEWTTLTNFLGGEEVAGSKMKSISGWNGDGNGTNESGFSAIPSGYLFFGEGGVLFDSFDGSYGTSTSWWSSTEESENYAWYRSLYSASAIGRDSNYKDNGSSVRCIKD